MKKKLIDIKVLLLYTTLILGFIFQKSEINIGKDLNICIGNIIYSFTYLITILLFITYKSTRTKESIIKTTYFTSLFFLIITIACNIPVIDKIFFNSLKEVFLPNTLYGLSLPSIKIIPYLIIFFISHYILIILYELLIDYTNYVISFLLSIIITYILDQTFYVFLSHTYPLLFKGETLVPTIINLTASYFVVITTTVLQVILLPIIKGISKQD